MGVKTIKLADTVGILTPAAVRHLVGQMKKNTDISLGIHTHNDLGMAVPIAIEAVKAGVTHVDTTLFGIGERAGNCDLFSLVSNGSPVFAGLPMNKRINHLQKQAADILFFKSHSEVWNCTNM
jgi:homocitrate synthase NifV